MRFIIRVLAFIALVISLSWLYFQRDFEPALSTIVSLSTLISTFLIKKENTEQMQQTQKVGNNSTAIQAGGNVRVSLKQQNEKKN